MIFDIFFKICRSNRCLAISSFIVSDMGVVCASGCRLCSLAFPIAFYGVIKHTFHSFRLSSCFIYSKRNIFSDYFVYPQHFDCSCTHIVIYILNSSIPQEYHFYCFCIVTTFSVIYVHIYSSIYKA